MKYLKSRDSNCSSYPSNWYETSLTFKMNEKRHQVARVHKTNTTLESQLKQAFCFIHVNLKKKWVLFFIRHCCNYCILYFKSDPCDFFCGFIVFIRSSNLEPYWFDTINQFRAKKNNTKNSIYFRLDTLKIPNVTYRIGRQW